MYPNTFLNLLSVSLFPLVLLSKNYGSEVMGGMEKVRCIPSDWEEEDCSYLLRELERTAFSCVVSAMRAQGIMNNFKEVLLDHLKAALFINDDVFKMEMKRAANDECLSKIASVLNPSYDCFTEWAGLGVDVEDDEFVPQPRLFDEGTTLKYSKLLGMYNVEKKVIYIHNTMAAHREFLNKIHQQIQDEARIVSQPEAGQPRKRKKTKQLTPEIQINDGGEALFAIILIYVCVPPITPIRQTSASSVHLHSTPLSAPSTTVLAGSVQKHSQSAPIPNIAPKSISSVQAQYLPQNTYKRSRLASVTENPSLPSGDTSSGNNLTNCYRDHVHRANPQTSMVKAVRSNFSPFSFEKTSVGSYAFSYVVPVNTSFNSSVTVNRTSMKFYSTGGGIVPSSVYGNPTRPYYGNPSAAVLGSQARSPAASASSSNSSQQTQSLPSTPSGHSPSPSTSHDNVNRIDYGLTRPSHLSHPIIKRSVFKSVHPTTTVRLSNGNIPLSQRISASSGLANNPHGQTTGPESPIINGVLVIVKILFLHFFECIVNNNMKRFRYI
uniref:ENT domain-containing protein n=1 Tax=Heterorhabditis bacteriophora TaxID=37862 RepID=A0A1I7X057_HETBA